MAEEIQRDEVREQLPPLETVESITAIDRVMEGCENIDISENELSLAEYYPDTKMILTFKEVGFGAIGGIQFITGHQKNGKTFLMAQLMAAILNNGGERPKEFIPGLSFNEELREEFPNPSVLYVDTEQEKENTAKVAKRVHWLCGWPLNVPNDRFHILWLRAEDSNERRWQKVKTAISKYNPLAVFVDGIRDMLGDFNDLKESASLINQCMAITTYKHCTFWSVLHENPGSDKMRGHLGTEAANKASDVLRVTKRKNEGSIVFDVEQVAARGRDIEAWQFVVTDDAGKLGVPKIVNSGIVLSTDSKKSKFTPEDWQRMTNFLDNELGTAKSLSKGKLERAMMKTLKFGSPKCRRFINFCIDMGVLIERPGGTWGFSKEALDEVNENINDGDDPTLPF